MMNTKLKLAVYLITLLGLGGCDQLRTFPKHIQEFPEPWQVLAPGKPVGNPPKVEIVTQGDGASIEPGDFVQIATKFWSIEKGEFFPSGEWWLWIGFRSSAETAFYASNPAQRAALLGLKEGSVLKFLENQDPMIDREEVYINPFGDYKYYSWRKNTNSFGKIFIPYQSGYSQVEIKRVCKGQLKYRTVRLFDDSPVRTGSGLRTRVTQEPRQLWIAEAKLEAKCQDGKQAVFHYGPSGTSEGGEPNFVVHGYFDDWLSEAWDKLPVGVQLK